MFLAVLPTVASLHSTKVDSFNYSSKWFFHSALGNLARLTTMH